MPATYPLVDEAQKYLKVVTRARIAPYETPEKFILTGDLAEVKLTQGTEDSLVPNNQTPSGGSSYSMSRPKDVKLSMKLFNCNGTLSEFAYAGSASDIASTSLTSTIQAYAGGIMIPQKGLTTESVVVEGIFDPIAFEASGTVKSPDGLTTYIKGTDYTVENDGIRIVKAGGIGILDTNGSGTPVEVTWTNKASVNIQALTNLGREFVLFFSGTDIVTNKAVNTKFYKAKLAPVKDTMLIDEKDMHSKVFEFEILVDLSRPYTTMSSQYYEVRMEK